MNLIENIQISEYITLIYEKISIARKAQQTAHRTKGPHRPKHIGEGRNGLKTGVNTTVIE